MLNVVRGVLAHPLTRNSRLSAFARIAQWQVLSRLQHEIVFTWVDGLKLAQRKGMTGATRNVYVGLHEFTDMAFLLHFLRHGVMHLQRWRCFITRHSITRYSLST